jgi:hypothetical protein
MAQRDNARARRDRMDRLLQSQWLRDAMRDLGGVGAQPRPGRRGMVEGRETLDPRTGSLVGEGGRNVVRPA